MVGRVGALVPWRGELPSTYHCLLRKGQWYLEGQSASTYHCPVRKGQWYLEGKRASTYHCPVRKGQWYLEGTWPHDPRSHFGSGRVWESAWALNWGIC